jgi:hypothetical protein
MTKYPWFATGIFLIIRQAGHVISALRVYTDSEKNNTHRGQPSCRMNYVKPR